MNNKTNLLLALALVVSMGASAENITEPTDTLNEVVVTGTNNATKSNLIPFSVTTISHEEIEATGRTQLLSSLSGRIPSLFISERSIFGFGVSTGGSGSIKIRGVGNSPTSQVLMMVDGKPQFSGVYSHPVADNYETDYIDHVEILRGPASVLYGSNAMGGAINVITKKEKEEGVYSTIQSQYGTYNTWQTAFTNSTRFGGFSSLVTLGYDKTDGTPVKKYGATSKFDYQQYSGYAKIGYDFNDNWNMYGDYSFMKFKGNDPIYAKLKDEKSTDVYHQDITRGEASLVLSDTYDKTNGAVRLYFSHGNHKIEDPKAFKSLDNRIGVLAYQNYQPWTYTNFTLGFDFDRYTGEIPLSGGIEHKEGSKTTIESKSIVEYSPYITASQGLWHNFLVLNAGVRISMSDMFGTHAIPQGGISINPGNGWNVKASLANGYRNPSFKELYLYAMANPNLEAENMMNYEVSVGKSFSNMLKLELTGYMSKGSNLIQTVMSSEVKHMLNVNTGEFNNKGIEFTASSRPMENLSLRASYSYLHTDLSDELKAGAPTHQYHFGADWRFLPKFLLNADITGISGLTVFNPIKKEVAEVNRYALLNLKLTYTPYDNVDVFVQGNNLTNAKYCINYGYDMPGATVTGGFKFRF